jgi:hypothetical protein
MYLPVAVRFDVKNTDLRCNGGCKLYVGFSIDGSTEWMYNINVTDELMSYDVTFTPGAIVSDKYRVDKCGCEYCSTCVRECKCKEIFEELGKGVIKFILWNSDDDCQSVEISNISYLSYEVMTDCCD